MQRAQWKAGGLLEACATCHAQGLALTSAVTESLQSVNLLADGAANKLTLSYRWARWTLRVASVCCLRFRQEFSSK